MTINLIDAFSLYLVLAFVTGTVLRARNYRAVVGLVYNSADRWPKLRALVVTHGPSSSAGRRSCRSC